MIALCSFVFPALPLPHITHALPPETHAFSPNTTTFIPLKSSIRRDLPLISRNYHRNCNYIGAWRMIVLLIPCLV